MKRQEKCSNFSGCLFGRDKGGRNDQKGINGKGEERAEIQGAKIQPLSDLRSSPGLFEKVSDVPDLLSEFSFRGKDSRGNQSELVR